MESRSRSLRPTRVGTRRARIRGEGRTRFYLEVAIDLEDEHERPVIEKLWAQARIRELENAAVGGRRAETMKERVIKLAQQYGVSSKHTRSSWWRSAPESDE